MLKGQASSPIQKLVWAAKKADEGEDSEGGDEPDSVRNVVMILCISYS